MNYDSRWKKWLIVVLGVFASGHHGNNDGWTLKYHLC